MIFQGILFSNIGVIIVHPQDNDLVVITWQYGNCDIKGFLIDPRSSLDILLWNTFQKLQFSMKTFQGSLIGLLYEHVQVKCHITLETTCNIGSNPKEIEVNYLVVDVLSPYNIIIGRPTINLLGIIIFAIYMVLK